MSFSRINRCRQRSLRHRRRGASTPEVALAFIVTFAFAITLYMIAQQSFGNLYQVISVFTGHPYL